MRWFRHTTAEYRCGKCARGRSVVGVDFSPFSLAMAVLLTLPWCVVLFRSPWGLSCYHGFGIFTGELLLLFVSGFVASPFLLWFDSTGTRTCWDCGAAMRFAGRHFTPGGSARPHWKDFVLWVVFVGLNVTIWLAL